MFFEYFYVTIDFFVVVKTTVFIIDNGFTKFQNCDSHFILFFIPE